MLGPEMPELAMRRLRYQVSREMVEAMDERELLDVTSPGRGTRTPWGSEEAAAWSLSARRPMM